MESFKSQSMKVPLRIRAKQIRLDILKNWNLFEWLVVSYLGFERERERERLLLQCHSMVELVETRDDILNYNFFFSVNDVWNHQYVVHPTEPTPSMCACKIKERFWWRKHQ